MPSTHERIEFAPPPQGGNSRALGMALAAHVLLMLALTWGVNWRKSDNAPSFEAELWSSVPQIAAPREVLPPPTPQAPSPTPTPKPEVKAPTPEPVQKDAEIALEREKKQRELEKKQEEEKDKKAEQDRLAKEKLDQEKLEKEKLAQAKKDKALNETRKREEDEKRVEEDRQRNMERIAGLAGASGAPNAAGTAQKSDGPSSGYGGRIKARVKPNIVFADEVAGNPAAEVEVRAAPDGTITGTRVVKSSGVKAWDDAVVRALERTETLPRDTDGSVPSPIIITFRPKEMLN
jgi:colicin import membrane protein